MRILNSKKAFLEHYARRVPNVYDMLGAAGKGGIAAGCMVGASTLAVGTTAAQASIWSAFTWLPFCGSLAAGNATAAGLAAGVAAVGGAAVIVPAAVVGGCVAYACYRRRGKRTLRKTSGVEELADAFARVACLPMLALAVQICTGNPGNVGPVCEYLRKELCAWGYSEEYVRAGFDEAMKYTSDELNGQYELAMKTLKSGSTDGIGATTEELSPKYVSAFADEFRRDFEACIG